MEEEALSTEDEGAFMGTVFSTSHHFLSRSSKVIRSFSYLSSSHTSADGQQYEWHEGKREKRQHAGSIGNKDNRRPCG